MGLLRHGTVVLASALLFEQGNLLAVARATAQAAHESDDTEQDSSENTHGNSPGLVLLELVQGAAVKGVNASLAATSIQLGEGSLEESASTVESTVGIALDGVFPGAADFVGFKVHVLVPVVVLLSVHVLAVLVVGTVGLLGVVLLLLDGLLVLVVRFGVLASNALVGGNHGFGKVREAASVVLRRELGVFGLVSAVFVVKGSQVNVSVVDASGSNVVLNGLLFLLVLVVLVLLVVAFPLFNLCKRAPTRRLR